MDRAGGKGKGENGVVRTDEDASSDEFSTVELNYF